MLPLHTYDKEFIVLIFAHNALQFKCYSTIYCINDLFRATEIFIGNYLELPDIIYLKRVLLSCQL